MNTKIITIITVLKKKLKMKKMLNYSLYFTCKHLIMHNEGE